MFGSHEASYLGHVIGCGTVAPDPTKLATIQNFPVPTSKTGVRAFLGLAGYYRRFIPNFSEVSTPLTNLTRKSAPTKPDWTPACQAAFDTLRSSLSSMPVLQNPNFQQPLLPQTDASEVAAGAVLAQKDADGLEHPVAYFSRKFLPREQRYSTVEK